MSGEIRQSDGINLRMAQYSEVDNRYIDTIRYIIHTTAMKFGSPLIAVPISLVEGESDIKTFEQLAAGFQGDINFGYDLDDSSKIVKQVGLCRIVITGSYHGAVFAIAQGIPSVCLAKSQYYIDKFMGLADQFGAGCEVLLLDDERLPEKLTAAIDRSWRTAEYVRPKLLEAAKKQIETGYTAYRQFFNKVESRKSVRSG